jgi:hypothetical protein
MPILVPSSGAEAWKDFLADPKHWQTGRSAKSLAYCWTEADGLPAEVAAVLRRSSWFAQAELLLAIPEHKVRLPGAGRASQTDLWLLIRTPTALASVAVEGKVDEPFGETVHDWLAGGSANRQARLMGLLEMLGLSSVPPETRYQLLHRTASAVLEARRFLAAHAMLLVHSFSRDARWFDDFAFFCRLLAVAPAKDVLLEVPGTTGPTLHLGWVSGDSHFLTR